MKYCGSQLLRSTLTPIKPNLNKVLIAHVYPVWADGKRNKNNWLGLLDRCKWPKRATVRQFMSRLRQALIDRDVNPDRVDKIMECLRAEQLTLHLCFMGDSKPKVVGDCEYEYVCIDN